MNKFFSDNTIPHCFAMNEYPYTFDDYSQHYILWINPLYEREYHIGSNLPNDVKQNINNIINNDDNNVDAFIVFENSKSCRTINSNGIFTLYFIMKQTVFEHTVCRNSLYTGNMYNITLIFLDINFFI